MGRDKGKGSRVFYGWKAIQTPEAVSHVAPFSDSQPFDTAPRAYSGQAMDLQEATSKPGICFYGRRETCLRVRTGR